MAQSPRAAKGGVKTLEKGFAVEESLRTYFAEQGFFALRSIPYRIAGTDLTDIDLWLYERPAAISRRRIIVDVKNKKSPQAAERIIWTKGLIAALRVDEGIVATTDSRSAVQRLSRSLGIDLINLPDFQKSSLSKASGELLPQAYLEEEVRRNDKERGETALTDALFDVKASIINNLGFGSGNLCINAFKFFCDAALTAPIGSSRRIVALRCAYISAACFSISIDFALAPQALKSSDARMEFIANGVRYGVGEFSSAQAKVRAAASLLEKYVENGKFFASQVEASFLNEAEAIPSEIIAQFVSKGSSCETLFDPACDLLRACLMSAVPGYDSLGPNAKALIGVLLDFSGLSRERFANLVPTNGVAAPADIVAGSLL